MKASAASGVRSTVKLRQALLMLAPVLLAVLLDGNRVCAIRSTLLRSTPQEVAKAPLAVAGLARRSPFFSCHQKNPQVRQGLTR